MRQVIILWCKALQDDSIVAHENTLWFETILDLNRHDLPCYIVAVKAFSLMPMLSALHRMRGPVHKTTQTYTLAERLLHRLLRKS
jgi:hypothetical protein